MKRLYDFSGSRNFPRVLFSSLLITLLATGCTPSPPETTRKLYDRFESFGSFGTGIGQFNKPRGVMVDGKLTVHVVDMTGRVQRFDTHGKYLGVWQAPETDKGRPKGMGVDPQGHLLLVEPHYKRVNHFDFDGNVTRTWGKSGVSPGELAFPRSIASDASSNLFVCEYLTVQRIQKFDFQGNFIKCWGQEGSGHGEFRRPEGIGTDLQGNVYVADSCNHRIQIFSNDGIFLRQIGKPGTRPGELNYPYDVKVDAQGRIHVCDFGNSRIQIFSPEGLPLEIIGSEGSGPWKFLNPWSIAFDDERNLWVADGRNHRVVKLHSKK